MTTVNTNQQLQRGLDDYSLAVQKYSLVVQQLPAPRRPPPLDRFRHRGNVHALRRRTAEVLKATERLLQTSNQAVPKPKEASYTNVASKASECHHPQAAVAAKTSGLSSSSDPEEDNLRATRDMHRAGGQTTVSESPDHVPQTQVADPEATVPVLAHGSAELEAGNSTHDSSQLFTETDVDLLIRIASGSPDAARICARRVQQLKTHGASEGDVQEVLQTVIRSAVAVQVVEIARSDLKVCS
ncbi:hypothetical protein FN846DRAFT_890923 [Sphaerosporella brunnea]|uniref:Uncharacterized protein n=1 Tax=Sphaerosporella brunnea TaxID=1250544 RepID=A0A5J5EUA3_9PEZI|nr:hypothetical protein FN846DRAFT_890923 [Sphaerosporella brunnea]